MNNYLSLLLATFSLFNLTIILLGTLVGAVVGALPGFTATMAIAILIPITYTWDASAALIFLGAIYCGSMYGGSITAILINTPGTAAAAATTIDGYALTQKGRSQEALTQSAVASFWGNILSVIVLLFFAPSLAKWAFNFGAQERFLLALFGLAIIASLSTKNMLKGLIMGCLGLLIATVGMDPVMGKSRFTFDTTYLLGGINLIPAVIGLFSITQVFTSINDGSAAIKKENIIKYKIVKNSIKDLFRYPLTYLRSSIIGIIIGIIPGTGGDVASYLSHNVGKIFSKDKEYGQGSPEGVAACEAANNAVIGGTLIPTLTLGIPGNATTAILLGGLTLHGLTPGYALFTSNADTVFPFIFSLFLASLLFLVIGLKGARYFALATLTPKNILSGMVIFLSTVGSYSIRGNINDVIIMLIFGILGYVLKLFKFSIVPIVLGMILGRMAEESLQQALLLYDGSLYGIFISFFTRPICIALILFIALSVAYPIYVDRKKKSRIEEKS
ncbi:MAG: tripartite tricarboxylate transporter permease [Spirochaetia bacterium]|nr:tripartite tricarboxylate transporter permease [Spirochaetia bacterium]